MGTLLISKPTNGRLNYQQTLAISISEEKGKIELEYSDWDKINNRDEWRNAILWKAECYEDKLKDKFLQFIKWNKNWT